MLRVILVREGPWGRRFKSEECRNPNHHYFSKKYRNTPPICIAIRLQFVLQYFWCHWALKKGKYFSTPPICIAIRLPFVLEYASHLYRSTFGKILVVVVTGMFPILLAGLETQTQNAAFFERKWPKCKPWHRGRSLNRKKTIAMRLLKASVLPRKALNRNLSWGFLLGNLLPKTRVLKHPFLERKRETERKRKHFRNAAF